MNIMRLKITALFTLLVWFGTTSCDKTDDVIDELQSSPRVEEFISGLATPSGIEVDAKGQLWVTQSGTGVTNDGQVLLITPQGQVYPVVQGFPSFTSQEGAIIGLSHVLLQDGTLWILHGPSGRLYKANVAAFKPGDAPLRAENLAFEDVGSFVKAHVFAEDTDQSNMYNVTVGPKGDFYFVDAAANAIIRRDAASGQLSVFAAVPAIANTGGDGLPPAESVPTGIVFDGQRFLVTTFTGFPFPPQQAPVYQFDLQGRASVYQTGFSNATDIELSADRHPLVIEYSHWTGQTFAPNGGRLLFSGNSTNTTLLTNLNFPTAITRSGPKTYYIAYPAEGKIRRINF